jgi:hydrogenase expression/formation protein HypD
MKYLDEYRGVEEIRSLARALEPLCEEPRTLMEVCGGQTHSFMRFGLLDLLPENLHIVHGPGCPVCVTPIDLIDHALEIARRPGVILASFGDMLRVPGSSGDLLSAKAEGSDVKVVYSPLDAVEIAATTPDREVVFFAVGFETTAPVNAMAVHQARTRGLTNFSILSSHVLVPPAMEAILSDPHNVVQAFLAAGHVCTIMGTQEYHPLAERFRVPIIVTGFEPLDLMQGTYLAVKALHEGRWGVENQYSRSVAQDGNAPAQQILQEVFRVCDRSWRGLGNLPQSGLDLRPAYQDYDAALKFPLLTPPAEPTSLCIAGEILRGKKKPPECSAFGTLCHPENPLGAPMVSSEGACAAYYRYRRT